MRRRCVKPCATPPSWAPSSARSPASSPAAASAARCGHGPASGAATGGLIAASFVGAAMVACGVRLPRWAATPPRRRSAGLGRPRRRPDHVPAPPPRSAASPSGRCACSWIDLAGVVAVVLLVVVGLAPGRAGRRSRRPSGAPLSSASCGSPSRSRTSAPCSCCGASSPRTCPATARGSSSGSAAGYPVWRRDWHGVLRFPAAALVRLVLLLGRGRRSACGPPSTASRRSSSCRGSASSSPGSKPPSRSPRTSTRPTAPTRCRAERGELLVRHLPATWTVMALLGVLAGVVVLGREAVHLRPRAGRHRRLPAGAVRRRRRHRQRA